MEGTSLNSPRPPSQSYWVPPPGETLGFGFSEDEQSEQMSDGLPVGGIPLALPVEEDGVTFAALKASLSVPVRVDMKA